MTFTKFFLWIKSYIFHKSFFLGLLVAIGSFSPYIFGPDNLAEEIAELFIFEVTGIDIDFTPEDNIEHTEAIRDIVELSKKHRFL